MYNLNYIIFFCKTVLIHDFSDESGSHAVISVTFICYKYTNCISIRNLDNGVFFFIIIYSWYYNTKQFYYFP